MKSPNTPDRQKLSGAERSVIVCKPSMDCPCGSYQRPRLLSTSNEEQEETESYFKIAFAEEFGL